MALKRITDYTLATTPLAGTEELELDISGSPFRTTSLDIAKTAVQDAINNGTTDRPPSQNAVFDALALKAPLASPTFTGVPAADTAAAGTNTTQLATTAFVKTATDAAVAGLSWKQQVRAATAAAGTLATDFENGDTIDGVVLATGDRILIKDQAAGAENGIYVVAASGAPARSTDADSGAELVNASVYVSEGTANADTQWTCSTNAPITVGVTSLAFAQLTAGGSGDVVGPASATDSAIALFDTTSGKLLKDSAVLLSALATLAGTNTFTAQNTFAAGTITTSQPLTITQTWNAAGVTFDVIDVNATATASAAASRLLNLRVGGSSVAFVRKDGLISGQTLWAGGVINTSGYVSLRGDPTAAGHYGIGYDNGNDATHVYTYATRKLILGSRAFAGTYNARFTFDDAAGVQTWTHAEAINYVFGTATGTKLGTATSQKIGLWNATPVIQPASASQAAVTDTAGATYTAAEQTMLGNLKTLLNQIRADLVTVGILKGAA